MFDIRMMIPIFDYSYSISDLKGSTTGKDIHSGLILKVTVPLWPITLSVVSLEPRPNIAGDNKHSVSIYE